MNIQDLIDELEEINRQIEDIDWLNNGRGVKGHNQKQIHKFYSRIEKLIVELKKEELGL